MNKNVRSEVFVPSDAHNSVVRALRANAALGSGDDFNIAVARAGLEAMTGDTVLPDGTECETISIGGIKTEWIRVPNSDATKVVLYLHGGGYALGSIDTHRGLGARIAEASGCAVLMPDYRLAPETPFPGAVEDGTAAYLFLLEQGIKAESIAIGGDSAGGGLTFATLVNLRDQGHPLPAAAFTLSPWVDMEGLGDSMESRAAADPMIQKDGLARFAQMYLADADPRSPLAAPLYADVSGLPPILIQVGTAEVLLDDAVRIEARLRESGGSVVLEQYEDLIHVFQAFAPIVPESVEAIGKIGAFVKSHL